MVHKIARKKESSLENKQGSRETRHPWGEDTNNVSMPLDTGTSFAAVGNQMELPLLGINSLFLLLCITHLESEPQ